MFSLIFSPQKRDFCSFEVKIGFLVNKYVIRRLEMTRIPKLWSKKLIYFVSARLVFHVFWPLGEGFCYFGPQSRILCEISALELDSQVWNRVSRSKNIQIYVLICFFNPFMGLTLCTDQQKTRIRKNNILMHRYVQGVFMFRGLESSR